jgi:hypothetical protein
MPDPHVEKHEKQKRAAEAALKRGLPEQARP